MRTAKIFCCCLLFFALFFCVLSVPSATPLSLFTSQSFYNSESEDIVSLASLNDIEDTVCETEQNDYVAVSSTSQQSTQAEAPETIIQEHPQSHEEVFEESTLFFAQSSFFAKKESVIYKSAANEQHIALNGVNMGSLADKNSTEIYTFTVEARGVLRYSLSHAVASVGEGWNVSLYQKYNSNGYDGESKWRLLNCFETSFNKSVDFSPNIGLYKGDYRLVVSSGQIFSDGEFTLKTEFSTDVLYEIECNDTITRYNETFLDVPVKGSSSSLGDTTDNDWFMFRLNSPTTVKLIFEHIKIETVSVNWRIILQDSNGNEIFAENMVGSVESFVSGSLGLEPGCYYIGVIGRVYTEFDYTLTVKNCRIQNFESEPNNTTEKADVLLLNSNIDGALISTAVKADRDVFVLDLTESGCLSLDFSSIQDVEDKYCWRVSLYDESNQCIWQTTVSLLSARIKSPKIGLGKGKYYVVIDNDGLFANSATYSLSNEFIAHDSWETEYNDSIETADEIFEDNVVSGTIVDRETDFDDDFFVFVLPVDAIVRVDISHEVLSGNKKIFAASLLDESQNEMQLMDEKNGGGLVDSLGNPVSIFYSKENNSSVSARYVLHAGTYYIRMRAGQFSSEIVYNLNIAFE